MSVLSKRLPRGTATFVLCFFLLFLFLRDSDVCFSEMKRGISICAGVLVPTLFPYMIISEMLVRANLGYYIGKHLEKPMRKIFGISGSGAGALILGIICGFPIGAKTASALYSRGELSKDEFGRLLAFCNYPSAPFAVFAVGKNLLGNTSLGIFLYSLNVVVGLVFGAFSGRKSKSSNFPHTLKQAESKQPLFTIITESVTSAAGAVISVCALVTFFTCAVGCLSAFDLINNLPILKAALFSFFELTSGVAACASLTSRQLAAVLTGAAVGWSGLSVLMQIYSSCAKESDAPSLFPYIKSRIISSAVCALCTAAALRLFPSFNPGRIPAADAFLNLSAFPSTLTFTVNTLFLISVLFYSNKKLDRKQMF